MDNAPTSLSNTKTRRLKEIIREYSRQLGLSDPGDRFTSRQHIIRICNKFPKIRAAVRPLGGKLTGEQSALFLRYMVENPIGDFHVGMSVGADRPAKANPKIDRNVLKKAKRKEAKSRLAFYDSWDWKKARYQILQKYGPRCMLCGSTRADLDLDGNPVRIVVDHIKPLSKHWHLRLDPENLQILCNDCNKGKGAWDETDYRPQSQKDAMIAKQLEYSV